MLRASMFFALSLCLSASAARADETLSAGEARRAAARAALEANERHIEKKVGDHLFKLTLRPGNLMPGRVADVSVEVFRVLPIPDPQWGDRLPMRGSKPLAIVQAPERETKKNRRRETPPPTRFVLWPLTNPGEYGFHFTPEHDGLYTLTITGLDPSQGGDSLEPTSFEGSFRLGVGSEAAQTEQSQGAAAARRTARRPVGGDSGSNAERALQTLMEQIGHRFLDLEDLLDNAPAKGANSAAAAEARAISELFSKAKGLVPAAHAGSSAEFDALLASAPAAFEAVALAAENVKDRSGARAAFEKAELQTCLQCHTKYRWNLTESVETWPKFQSKDWSK